MVVFFVANSDITELPERNSMSYDQEGRGLRWVYRDGEVAICQYVWGFGAHTVLDECRELYGVKKDPGLNIIPLGSGCDKNTLNPNVLKKAVVCLQSLNKNDFMVSQQRNLIKKLRPNIYEIRVTGETLRFFTYMKDDGQRLAVLIKAAKTHSGKGKKDTGSGIEAVKKDVKLIEKLLQETDIND